ncbi:MAG TPA: TetR/AcrR family transcriptional regulator [Sphingobium sp.]
MTDAKRSYRQGARAEASQRTADAIVRAFATFLETEWYNDVSLERIAAAADVTVPTVLRHFGSKEGILTGVQKQFETEIIARRAVAPGNIDGAIAVVVEDYETAGDMVLRFLAQEDRVPAIRTVTDFGRSSHRGWVGEVFKPYLDGLTPDRREWMTDCLSIALDIYVWKLMRRDRGRSAEDVRAYMKSLVCSMIGPTNGV